MKSLALLSVFLFFIIFSSCRKDFTCTCSKIYKNQTGSNTRDFSKQTFRDTRKNAETKCKALETSGDDDLGDYSLKCEVDC
jgi:hypothetical protein